MAAFESMEDIYTPKYCEQLEAAYGDGMMSEGGKEAIDFLFEGVPIQGKKALDIGSGLGGVAIYVAEKFGASVTGLDVNGWMVEQATKRIPDPLKEKVSFVKSTSNTKWPFQERSFDIVFSKGVLTHVEHKEGVFKECLRILKDDGLLVISDCLSAEDKKWGEHVKKLMELEKLVCYPESISSYITLLEGAGFDITSIRDDTSDSQHWNMRIIDCLKDQFLKKEHLKHFTEEELAHAIEGYEAIANACQLGEWQVIRFIAKKKLKG